jgi:hypothetical protein
LAHRALGHLFKWWEQDLCSCTRTGILKGASWLLYVLTSQGQGTPSWMPCLIVVFWATGLF